MMTNQLLAPALAAGDVLKYMRPTILVTDRVGNILQAHGGCGRPLGYLAEELVGQHGLMVIAPEDHQIIAETYLAADDLPIVAAPEPFPVRMIGPDDNVRVWDCVPGGFSEGDQEGWVLTLTCRSEQNTSIEARDCFIDGGTSLDIARVVADRYQRTSCEQWRKNALVFYRDTLLDGTLSDWKLLDPPAGTPLEITVAATDCLEAEDAPWNTLDPGTMLSDAELPPALAQAASRAGLPYSTALATGVDSETRIVFVRLSNFARDLQMNNKLADKAVEATLRRSLAAEQSRAMIDKTMRLDPLTGIANRLHFDEVIGDNKDASSHAVLYVDIDKFKSVNDTYGHAAGDATLQVVANRIVRACRPNDLVARIGGDEFAVILRGVTAEAAEGIAARIRASMHLPLNVGVGPDLITVTIGIATSSDDESLAELVRQADHAMLARKPIGRGGYADLDLRREPVVILDEPSRRGADAARNNRPIG